MIKKRETKADRTASHGAIYGSYLSKSKSVICPDGSRNKGTKRWEIDEPVLVIPRGRKKIVHGKFSINKFEGKIAGIYPGRIDVNNGKFRMSFETDGIDYIIKKITDSPVCVDCGEEKKTEHGLKCRKCVAKGNLVKMELGRKYCKECGKIKRSNLGTPCRECANEANGEKGMEARGCKS